MATYTVIATPVNHYIDTLAILMNTKRPATRVQTVAVGSDGTVVVIAEHNTALPFDPPVGGVSVQQYVMPDEQATA